MKTKGDDPLFREFSPIPTEEWEEKIYADLKGADYEKKLVWKTPEGIPVRPYYRDEDLKKNPPYPVNALRAPAGAPNGWVICQNLEAGKDPEKTRERVQAAWKGGARAIQLIFNGDPDPSRKDLERILAKIPLNEAILLFRGISSPSALYHILLAMESEQDSPEPELLRGCLGADPLGDMVARGVRAGDLQPLASLIREVREVSPHLKVMEAGGGQFQDAGSTLVEELGFTLAMAHEYMAGLTRAGLEPSEINASLQVRLAAGPNYFMEIAKLRAFRILWAGVCAEYGLAPEASTVPIHSVTSRWNLTLYDPHVNMLRGTTQAMSAVLGGADFVSVLPFDHPAGDPGNLSDRMARNVQIILREEAYLDRVEDPSAGSYYIEHLTDALASRAWELFRETESKGGFIKAMEAGWIQASVGASRKKKSERLASGKDHLLGTNAFPLFGETLSQDPVPDQGSPEATPVEPLPSFRIAEEYETLRRETDSHPTRPSVFLLKTGNPGWATARAGFSANFFACAGYTILDPPAFNTPEEGIRTAAESGADVVVLCSADDTYPSLAPFAAKALNEKAIVVVAGYPAGSVEELKSAGIEHFIHVRSPLLETLREFNRLLLKK